MIKRRKMGDVNLIPNMKFVLVFYLALFLVNLAVAGIFIKKCGLKKSCPIAISVAVSLLAPLLIYLVILPAVHHGDCCSACSAGEMMCPTVCSFCSHPLDNLFVFGPVLILIISIICFVANNKTSGRTKK